MRTRIAIAVLTIWVCCAACSDNSQPSYQPAGKPPGGSPSESETVNGEDAVVLRAVLDAICRGDGKSYFVISDHSLSSKDFESTLERGRPEYSNVLRRNEIASHLPPIATCPSIRIVSETNIEAAFSRKIPAAAQRSFQHPGWEGFYSTYPKANGLMRLSWPGYSSDRRRAVVIGSSQAESLIGFGFLYTLEKIDSTWRVVSVTTLWQS
jgi:hypothetical protein